MQTVTLGATPLEVPPLADGTWQFGGDWGAVDERAAIEVFAALGRATAWLGPAGNGTRAKLVLNNWLADFTPAFALKHALKDADLAAQAAQASGTELTLTGALLPRWRHAAASGARR